MKTHISNKLHMAAALCAVLAMANLMAENSIYWLDDRSGTELNASNGEQWRLVTDTVMGGVSQGQLTTDNIDGQSCLHMQGQVRLDNNGGFMQMALDLSPEHIGDITRYRGITLAVQGNDESYNIHLRTSNLWLPWQSYRATFSATPQWQVLSIPFSDFTGYRLSKPFKLSKLKRIGLVAIGREFYADLCVGKVGLYR